MPVTVAFKTTLLGSLLEIVKSPVFTPELEGENLTKQVELSPAEIDAVGWVTIENSSEFAPDNITGCDPVNCKFDVPLL